MSFEEQFPSLNKAINDEPFNDKSFIVAQRLLSATCLDKQKVREAIINCTHYDSFANKIIVPEQLLKELEL